MGKFDGIIIASDIDGTFLGKGGRMVPENLAAIEYFKAEGGCFTIATGRESFLLPKSILAMPDLCNIPIVACTGAYVYDLRTGAISMEEFLPEPDVSAIVEATRAAFPQVSMRIACGGRQMTEQDSPEIRSILERYPGSIEITPYEDMPHGKWHQITWLGDPEEMPELRKVIDSRLTDRCVCNATEARILTLNSSRATKGAMLNRLKAVLGIENTTLWTIGDYENDVAMLRSADRCATPADGLESLRSIPGIVVVRGHDEGAIAGLIEYIDRNLTN